MSTEFGARANRTRSALPGCIGRGDPLHLRIMTDPAAGRRTRGDDGPMYDLVVLGGGAGGLGVATAAARLGAKVALIEAERLGGACTHHACVPSKALIRAARLAYDIRRAGDYGLRVAAPEIDFAAVMDRVRGVVAEFAGSGTGASLKAQGIDVLRGSPRFEAYDTVLLDGHEPIVSKRFVIATGSRPAVPDVPGLAEAGFLDNVSIWDQVEQPASLVVIGGGPVGVEFAQAFARLGTEVTILSSSPHILPEEVPEVADRLRIYLAAEGITIHTNVEVDGVALREGLKVCAYRDKGSGSVGQAAGTHLLVATGRWANVEGLNLEAVGIHADREHGIEVDDYLQTRSRHIWAIGDVLGRHLFTHCAEREAAVAFQNALLHASRHMDYTTLPRVTFTDPEVATVGVVDPEQVGGEHGEVQVFRVENQDVDRPRIDGQTLGFARVLATASGRILGATIVGDEAGTILQEFVLAMEHGLSLAEIAETFHAYPTRSGLALKLANQYAASRAERGFLRSALRLLHGYQPRAHAGPHHDGERVASLPAADAGVSGHHHGGH